MEWTLGFLATIPITSIGLVLLYKRTAEENTMWKDCKMVTDLSLSMLSYQS